jgi:uncharacterized repeat protein (TIGR03803 family)
MWRTRIFVALCVLAASSCGRVDPTLSPAAAAPLTSFRAQPDTLHVVPFLDFGGKTGYNSVGPMGGRGGLIGDETALYGATFAGGNVKCSTQQAKGCGLIYELSLTSGSSYKFTPLHKFGGMDGAAPDASLIMDASGSLYGTTFFGGTHGEGTVFKLSPSQSGYTESVLHSFGGSGDGAYPAASLINVNGMLYGTTVGGGVYSGSQCGYYGTCGTAFSVSAKSGKERVLHSFGGTGDGADPYAGLIYSKGALYGTTDIGGANFSCGTVFSMTTAGNEHVLYSFLNVPDGCNPFGNLLEVNGILYGTTCCGGTYYGSGLEGTIFSVSTTTGAEQVLHNFGGSGDGSEPQAGLIAVKGALYGTTGRGGLGSSGCCGVVFSMAPSGASYSVLHRFRRNDQGAGLHGALLWTGGSFFGTTVVYGKRSPSCPMGCGTAFKLSP